MAIDRPLPLPYLSDYPSELLVRVRKLIEANQLGEWLREHYPNPAVITNDKALYQYVMDVKNDYLKTAPPLRKICFDDKICTLNRSLGQHSYVTRVQGRNLKSSNELRISSLFKETPPQFLRMVVIHELAHLREREHNKPFYQLCCRMEPNYFQYELGLRLYLTHHDLSAKASRLNTH
jgi:predicted metal-dependent hydrolase